MHRHLLSFTLCTAGWFSICIFFVIPSHKIRKEICLQKYFVSLHSPLSEIDLINRELREG